jgi:hypothetical protein
MIVSQHVSSEARAWRPKYQLISETLVPTSDDKWDTALQVPKAVSNTIPAAISRVAYCLRLGEKWVWTSFDWTDTSRIGVPADYQINGEVKNMNQFSNKDGIADQTAVTGRAEFWHNCYRRRLGESEYAPGTYGANDSPADEHDDCYGSMQIHTAAGQTLFGFNGWSYSGFCDLTIGNHVGTHQDGTLNNACNTYHGDGKSGIYTYVLAN